MYLLFDIGGTKTRVATSDGTTIQKPTIFPTPDDYTQGLKIFHQFKDTHPEAVVGGIAGPLAKGKEELEASPQLPGWIDKSLKKNLEEIFKVPVFLENDAALAGLGEALHGAGVGYSVVAYLTISTGVGGVKIVDGKIDKNIHGFEPGQMLIEGKKLADLISGMAIEKKYGKKPESINDQNLWTKVAKFLAEGLNNIIVDWSPDVIVLGGSILKSINLEVVEQSLKTNLTIFKDIPNIKRASLGDMSGLYGALEYLKQNHAK